MRKRVQAFFSGRVQGVGFRYSVRVLSRRCQVVGYVKNLVDGRVEVIAEGEEKELQHFVQSIKKSPLEHNIEDSEVLWFQEQGEFTKFEIAF